MYALLKEPCRHSAGPNDSSDSNLLSQRFPPAITSEFSPGFSTPCFDYHGTTPPLGHGPSGCGNSCVSLPAPSSGHHSVSTHSVSPSCPVLQDWMLDCYALAGNARGSAQRCARYALPSRMASRSSALCFLFLFRPPQPAPGVGVLFALRLSDRFLCLRG